MNNTAESSFAPLEYYKKLTNCLAKRKNLKLNISKIQGSRQIQNLKSTPFITNRKIQHKFLANYCMRKQFNENQRQQQAKLANNRNDEPLFKVMNNNNAALNEKLKRKTTTEESYINLSDSYFKDHQVPNLTLFKAPEYPPIKKQKIQLLPNTVNTSNFTLGSLFSGNFNPPQCSTPKDQVKTKPQPIIADPNDILGSLENWHFQDGYNFDQNMNERLKAAKELDKLKEYKNFVDDAASYVESVCFGELTDPILAIIKKLSNKHEEASQSPRPSLVSPQIQPTTFNDAIKTPTWPIPIFYNETNNMTPNNCAFNDNDDINPLFENTKDLFSFLDEDDKLDLDTSGIELAETPATSQTSFFSNIPHPSANTYLASTQISLTPYPKSPNVTADDLKWLEYKFATSMDMSWGTESNTTFANNGNNLRTGFSAIFRSPPKANNLDSKIPFSRTISRPKTYNRSESDGFFDKEDDFSWWLNVDDNTARNNTFMQNDTLNLFDTNFSLF